MKKILTIVLLGYVVTFFVSFIKKDTLNSEVPYPEEYRSWSHVKTALIDSQSRIFNRFGGFHHIYANDKAMRGLKTGSYEDGAVIVFDVLEAIRKGGNIVEGKRRMIDVMVKDSKKYGETGGWGFEEFEEDSKTERVVKEAAKEKCFNCHSSRTKNDFVFSDYRK